jgi:hypothetical protein
MRLAAARKVINNTGFGVSGGRRFLVGGGTARSSRNHPRKGMK